MCSYWFLIYNFYDCVQMLWKLTCCLESLYNLGSVCAWRYLPKLNFYDKFYDYDKNHEITWVFFSGETTERFLSLILFFRLSWNQTYRIVEYHMRQRIHLCCLQKSIWLSVDRMWHDHRIRMCLYLSLGCCGWLLYCYVFA